MNCVSQSAVSFGSISRGDGPRRSEGMATNAKGSPLFVELFFAAFRDEEDRGGSIVGSHDGPS